MTTIGYMHVPTEDQSKEEVSLDNQKSKIVFKITFWGSNHESPCFSTGFKWISSLLLIWVLRALQV